MMTDRISGRGQGPGWEPCGLHRDHGGPLHGQQPPGGPGERGGDDHGQQAPGQGDQGQLRHDGGGSR